MAYGDVTVTEGTGIDVGGDSVTLGSAGSKFVQIIKMLIGAEGAGTPISGNVGAPDAGTLRVALADISNGEYETVAASQTAQVIGSTGAIGDYIQGILVVPATTSPGNVLLLDNATSMTVFTGGTTSVSNLVPFFIPLGLKSVSGAWKITTGASVSAIAIGNFT